MAGWPGADATVEVIEEDESAGRLVALYGRGGKVVGVLGLNRPRQVMQYRMQIEAGLDWDDAIAAGPVMSPTVLLVAALAVAVVDWIAVGVDKRKVEYVAKPLTMVALLGVRRGARPDGRRPPAGGSSSRWCSRWRGDVFLMLPSNRFVEGLASFLVGHLAYIGGLVAWGTDIGPAWFVLVALLAAFIITIGGAIVQAAGEQDRRLRIPVGASTSPRSRHGARRRGHRTLVVPGRGPAVLRLRRHDRDHPLRARLPVLAGGDHGDVPPGPVPAGLRPHA